MPQLLIRGLDPHTIYRVRAAARARGTRTPDEAASLIVEALDARDARSAGGVVASARMSAEARRARASAAARARWAMQREGR